MSSTNSINRRLLLSFLQAGWVLLFIPALVFGLANIGYALKTVFTEPVPSLTPANFDAYLEHFRTLSNAYLILLSFSVAAYLFWKRRDDWFSMIASIGVFTVGISDLIISRPVLDAYPRLAGFYVVINLVNRATFMLLLYTLPNGRFQPRWTRWMALFWLTIISIWFLFPDSPIDLYGRIFVPFRPLRLLWVAIGIGVLVYRYRNIMQPEERQQSKWLLLCWIISLANLFVVVLTKSIIPRFEALPEGFLELLVIYDLLLLVTASTVFPLLLLFSLLRVSLWEVDYITNRMLALGGVVHASGAILFTVYVLVFKLLERFTVSNPAWIAAPIATGLMLLALRPLSNLIIDMVDRYIYGIRINYRHQPTLSRTIPSTGQHPATLQGYGYLEYLAEGGMSQIYRAFHPHLRKTVAIKILKEELREDERLVQRFQREAEILSQLDHPAIIKLIDSQIVEEEAYLVMELIDGQNLHEHFKHFKPLPLEQIKAIIGALAGALDHLHQKRIVHRDVKPSNVMMEAATLRVVLMDFGLAVAGFGNTEGVLTGTGIVGTVNYMAPEQIRRKPYLDGRCDIYSLGVLAYYLLTGRLPFQHDNVGATLIAHLMHPVPNPAEINPSLSSQAAQSLLKALAKEPDQRYASATLFTEDLFGVPAHS